MKSNETQKMKADEMAFSSALVVILLIIIPSLPLGKYGGGIAMVVFSIIGLIAYFVAFGKRIRNRGQMRTMAAAVALSAVLGGAIAIALR
jgi:hypothetical protein